MQANKKNCSFLILAALIFPLAGCQTLQEPLNVVLNPNQQQSDAMSSKRFQDAVPNRQTAIESAVELSEKNTTLFEQVMVLRQENQELTTENRKLKDRVAVLEPELEQANKHLSDADDLLIEMRLELNNWKTNILGYRDEMRDADKAQLETLLRILKVLGGEVKLDSGKTESKEINIPGESNE